MTLMVEFKPSASRRNFQILTPHAVAAVRGTTWAVEVNSDQTSTLVILGFVEVTRPDASYFIAAMDETGPGRFACRFVADISGLYTMRVRAIGSTFQGTPFQREQTLSAAVYLGATQPPQTGGPVTDWCDLLQCIVGSQVIDRKLVERLREAGVNLDALLKCLEEQCGTKGGALLR